MKKRYMKDNIFPVKMDLEQNAYIVSPSTAVSDLKGR